MCVLWLKFETLNSRINEYRTKDRNVLNKSKKNMFLIYPTEEVRKPTNKKKVTYTKQFKLQNDITLPRPYNDMIWNQPTKRSMTIS